MYVTLLSIFSLLFPVIVITSSSLSSHVCHVICCICMYFVDYILRLKIIYTQHQPTFHFIKLSLFAAVCILANCKYISKFVFFQFASLNLCAGWHIHTCIFHSIFSPTCFYEIHCHIMCQVYIFSNLYAFCIFFYELVPYVKRTTMMMMKM